MTNSSLTAATARELLDLQAAGEATAVEIVSAHLSELRRRDSEVHAFLRVNEESALAQAADIDRRRAAREPLGKLAGLPVAVKDNICVQGEPTTCASWMLEQFRPPYDAAVIERLKTADAVLIGKTNLDEFAMGGSCENSAFGPTCNPWDASKIPGGSSGGSAAAVAAGMSPLAVGSDTGGSIRQPAALCGVTGLKPTYGRVSRYGLVAFASSLDQIGPFGRTAEDCALLLEVLAGHDGRDSTSVDRPVPEYARGIGEPLAGLRLGVLRGYSAEGMDAEVEAALAEAVRVYQSLGAKLVDVTLPHSKHAVATYYLIASSEASGNLARYDGAHFGFRAGLECGELAPRVRSECGELAPRARSDSRSESATLPTASRSEPPTDDSPLLDMYRRTRSEGFGAEVKRRIMLGTYALSAGYYDAYYLKALRVRRLIRQDYDAAFEQVDVLLGPVTSTPAFAIGEKAGDPLAMYLVDLFTVGANLAGVCGISIPCGFSSAGLPIGLQLQAAPFEEQRLLRTAHLFQQATDWHSVAPRSAR